MKPIHAAFYAGTFAAEEYFLFVASVDASGNVAFCTTVVNVTENTIPPSVTCPGFVVADLPANQATTAVTWAPPYNSDGVSGVSSYSPSVYFSGYVFPLGLSNLLSSFQMCSCVALQARRISPSLQRMCIPVRPPAHSP